MLKYLPFLSLLICFGCTPKNQGSNDNDQAKCNTVGTVKDFTGLDGCKFLIVLENGDKLLPAKMNDQSFAFKDGQQIKFGYKKMDSMASICMAEKMSVEVTCIELVDGGNIPVKPKCHETADPTSVDWMKLKMDAHSPSQVIRYSYLDGWAYFYKTDTKRSYLYDCQGGLVCEVETDIRQCTRPVNDPDGGLVIYDVGRIPVKPICYETAEPMGVTWMRNKIEEHQPAQILRYSYLDGWAYFYKTDTKRSYLYDCQGGLVCEVETDIRQCKRPVNNPDDGLVVYDKNVKPSKPTCYQTTNAAEVAWMSQKIETHRPQQVMRYDYLDGWAYLFKTDSKRSYLYDCQGNLLCEVEVDVRQCVSKVKNPDQGLVVYQGA